MTVESILESMVVEKFGWPSWAVRLIAGLLALVLVTAGVDHFFGVRTSAGVDTTKSGKVKPSTFRWFQFNYLAVYLITMLADWLQGTNMYTLYAVSIIRLSS